VVASEASISAISWLASVDVEIFSRVPHPNPSPEGEGLKRLTFHRKWRCVHRLAQAVEGRTPPDDTRNKTGYSRPWQVVGAGCVNKPLSADLDIAALAIVEACMAFDSAEERDRHVAERCADAPALKARVEHILAMEEAPFRLIPTEAFTVANAPPEPLPERIGAFRVIEQIGRGGMGTVVKAERDDGVYSQIVAIKLIRADLGDARGRERFAQERRILARLSHPTIARILDGGTIDDRPYLVMDYVDGEPVTIALDARQASLADTLDCFLEICAAVSHAHRQLVVHADIKPSNVILGADGVRLLDFGIARLTVDLDLDEVEGPYPLTRFYAAPERVAGGAPTIVGDVFSLTVLLHEMLTGQLPDEAAKLPLSAVAAAHPGRFAPRQLSGDLDAIVARGLAADPARRYPDVGVLADEVRRFRINRPVQARGRAFSYLAERFLKRNRVPVLAAALVVMTLIAATTISLNMFLDARRARLAAEARFEEVRTLAKYQLFTLYDSLAGTPGTVAAREQLTEEAQSYLNRLAAFPGASDAVLLDVARGFDRLAEIQGVPSIANLGRVESARANLGRAAVLLEAILARDPANRAVMLELGRNRLMLADLALWQDADMAAARAALARGEPLVARARSGSAEWIWIEAYRRNVHADTLGWGENYAEELTLSDSTVTWLATLPAAEKRKVDYVIASAEAQFGRSEALYYLGRPIDSLAVAEAADRLLIDAERHFPHDARLLGARLYSGYNLITSLEALRRRTGLLDRSLALAKVAQEVRALEPNDQQIARRARNADALAAQYLAMGGRLNEAIAIQRRVTDGEWAKHRANPADPRIARDYAVNAKVLGEIYWEGGQRETGCALWRRSAAIIQGLERRGKLNDWDKSNVLAGLLAHLDVCDGRKPVSAYRGGNI